MFRTCLAVLAVTALPVAGALADPISPSDDGDMMREIARGVWEGRDYVATAGTDGEALHLQIKVGDTLVVDNPAISNFAPVEGASYALRAEADGTLVLDINETDKGGTSKHQVFRIRGEAGDVRVTGFDLTIGWAGQAPDFVCTLDLVGGRATIQSNGNDIPSPFTGAPPDQTTAQAWNADTYWQIGGCVNPG
ncbi:MAG: hypothetical protein Q4G26_00855 [Paracoccus sp. (in: a-proteobacteria)]|nr:hypothetical protein [Paracoccus sp. (in: a-proteobacteria)]